MLYQYKTKFLKITVYTVDIADSGWPRPSPGPMDYRIMRRFAFGEMFGRSCSPARSDTDFAASFAELANGD
jgi:hypothetical protein